MPIDVNAILSDTRSQKAIARAMAKMRASGSWKAGALDSIFNTMAAGRERDYMKDLLYGSKKEATNSALARSRSQFDARASLARDKIDYAQSDANTANIVAGIGAGVAGYSGYQDYQDDKQLAAEMLALKRKVYGG